MSGVGRSGTSLTMQALARLGAAVSQEVVPASSANRRGALEDLQVRDRMVALWRRFGRFATFRPDAWRDDPVTRETQDWLAEYLGTMAAGSEAGTFAVKFPLSSLFLPIWFDAAESAGISLRLIWATRGAEATVASFLNAYDCGQDLAECRYLQRSFYIMKDMPESTLLLPSEGWEIHPAEQITALAETTGIPLEDATATLTDLYDPSIIQKRSLTGPAGLSAMVQKTDRAVSGRRGYASAVLGKDARTALTQEIGETLAKSRFYKMKEGDSGEMSQDNTNVSIAHWSLEWKKQTERIGELKRENENLHSELHELKEAYAGLCHARDAADTAQSDLRAAHANEVARESDLAVRTATREIKTSLAEARKKETAANTTARKMQQEVQKAKRRRRVFRRTAQEAQERLNMIQTQLDQALAHTEWMRKSFRWEAADTIVETVRRPRLRGIALPIDLIRLWVRHKREG